MITLRIQKQSPIGILQKLCSANMQQIYWRTCGSVISVNLGTNFIEITLPNGRSPLNLLLICRTAVLTNTYVRPLLQIFIWHVLPYFSIQIRVKFGLFSNIFLTNPMFCSGGKVFRLPEFSLFLFRLVPYEWYFVKFCWIIFLQGSVWLNRCQNAAWTAM